MTGGVTEALAGPDPAVWHQEADLSDPGAPSRLIEPAAEFPDFWTSWAATRRRAADLCGITRCA